MSTEAQAKNHLPINVQDQWLRLVIRGHFNYFGVPGNPSTNRVRLLAGCFFLYLLVSYAAFSVAELSARSLPFREFLHTRLLFRRKILRIVTPALLVVGFTPNLPERLFDLRNELEFCLARRMADVILSNSFEPACAQWLRVFEKAR